MKKVLSIVISAFLCAAVFITPLRTHAATPTGAGVVTLSYGNLNVRSGASTTASIVSRLANGSFVTLISKSGNWWYVEYSGGAYGYCHADYIKTTESRVATVTLSYGNLNVRCGTGTDHDIIHRLKNGEHTIVLGTSGNWSRILYSGTKTGYVSSQYLSSGTSAVSLNVPSFKQTDSRWANVTIGSSGKTISQIGCATTAIAMVESFRTGATIYPDAMSKKLKYTSGGSVYWPSNYTAVTSSSGYLSKIYNQLKSGKAVLFGAKNSYGSQHWVVITGFSGGSLTAANFKINDPGSNTRTNLQQLLNTYPTFYKYFTY